MEGNSFWLIYLQEKVVSVSLVSSNDKNFQVLSTGTVSSWDISLQDSLSHAIDESLSVASINAGITEDQEPSSAAFVIPPFWVGVDSKISTPKQDIIKSACKQLDLRPTGYLAEDDAIVEDANAIDGFPASFILLHLSSSEFYLSLVYLGHIKQRIVKTFNEEFSAQLVEAAILELKSESTLPPQIIVFGQVDENIVSSLKNFPWVGKKNIETFLHFPEIKQLDSVEIIRIFSKVISFQFNPSTKNSSNNLEMETEIQETTIEENSLFEAEPEDLGFFNPSENTNPSTSQDVDNTSVIETTDNLEFTSMPELELPTSPELPGIPTVKKDKKKFFSINFLKKIKLPKINFKLNNFFWIFLITLPIFVLLFLFFIKSQIIFFLNPYNFDKSLTVTLKTNSDQDQISKLIIPVESKTFEVASSVKINTTGQITTGEKSKGEVTIFNKDTKVQNIPKGSILVDPSGKKFELVTEVSVAASSSNLEEGIMNLGQTKTAIVALDVGPEYNINTNIQLSFKDYPENLLIAKTNESFTGGKREQLLAVSQQDKTNIEEKLNQQITLDIETKISNDFSNIPGVIRETIQTKKSKIDLSREIGEKAEDIQGSTTSTVSVFIISEETKKAILLDFLSSETDFDKIELDITNFQFSFKPSTINQNQSVGELKITGSSLPKIDTNSLKKQLTLKTVKQVDSFLKKTPRLNRFKILNNFPIMPLRANNIDIQVKLEKQ